MVKKRYILLYSIIFHGIFASFAAKNYFASKQKKGEIYYVNLSFVKLHSKKTPKLYVEKKSTSLALKNTHNITEEKNKNIQPNSINEQKKQNGESFVSQVLYSPHPNYPLHAQSKGIQAEFQVIIKVSQEGEVVGLSISDHPYLMLFKSSIENTLIHWKFVRNKNNGKERIFSLPLIFKLCEKTIAADQQG